MFRKCSEKITQITKTKINHKNYVLIDCPAFSSSDTKLASMHGQRESQSLKSPPSACCDCFISTTGARNSIQLSEVYCPFPDHHITDSPSCLTTVSQQRPCDQIKTLLNVESEIEYSKNFNKKLVLKISSPSPSSPSSKGCRQNKSKQKSEQEVYEIACEAADADEIDSCDDAENVKLGIMTENDKKHMIRVNGKEELPCEEQKMKKSNIRSVLFSKKSPKKSIKTKNIVESSSSSSKCAGNNNNNNVSVKSCIKIEKMPSNEHESSDGNNNCDDKASNQLKYSTLPMVNKQKHKKTIAIPQRITPDGTKIYYLCDLPKRVRKGPIII